MNPQRISPSSKIAFSQDRFFSDKPQKSSPNVLSDGSLEKTSSPVASSSKTTSTELKLRLLTAQSSSKTPPLAQQEDTYTDKISSTHTPSTTLEDVPGVMTKVKLRQMTPNQALQRLKEGNARFIVGDPQHKDTLFRVKTTGEEGQAPFASIVSCIDSRVTPAIIFDQGVGDIFSSRVAGNIINEDILGGLEYASKAVGTKLIVVMGHTDCGAVKGTLDGVHLGNLTQLTQKIRPAADATPNTNGDDRSSSNREFVQAVAENNVKRAVKMIYDQSPELSEMANKGEINITSAMYHVETGKVFFEPKNT
jgi:carbonic anhydrase